MIQANVGNVNANKFVSVVIWPGGHHKECICIAEFEYEKQAVAE